MLYLLAVMTATTSFAQGKIQKLPLDDQTNWQIFNRSIVTVSKDSVAFGQGENEGMWIWKGTTFTPQTIEFDVRGENNMDRSFVGIAFNLQDEKTYEGIYFRPFNFYNPDTIRRWRAVQYICAPNYPWFKLREDSPGKYENKVWQAPNGDDWFHVKITVDHPVIKVYVNKSNTPTLVVNSLSEHKSGRVALWMGNQARGTFANLVVK